MNNAIKDLLTSDNEEDIRLGILIAKQQGYSAKDVFDVYLFADYRTEDFMTLIEIGEIFFDYITVNEPGDYFIENNIREWK